MSRVRIVVYTQERGMPEAMLPAVVLVGVLCADPAALRFDRRGANV